MPTDFTALTDREITEVAMIIHKMLIDKGMYVVKLYPEHGPCTRRNIQQWIDQFTCEQFAEIMARFAYPCSPESFDNFKNSFVVSLEVADVNYDVINNTFN